MRSSTSSSEHTGLRASLVTVARAGGPTAITAALLLATTGLLTGTDPGHAPRRDLESIVVEGQRERAVTIPDADVLIVGDSSALMGIDAELLAAALGGKRVESLATIGYVGPAGFAHLLEDYAAAGRRPRTVLLAMHGVSLALKESAFERLGFEAMAAGRERQSSWPTRAREAIYRRILAPLLDLPLPGVFGRTYGRPADLAATLRRDHGTLVDPNTFTGTPPIGPFRFALSDAVAARLTMFEASCRRLGVSKLAVIIAPIPDSSVGADTLTTRSTVAADVRRRLGGAVMLSLPPSLPDGDFASLTHLDAAGRARYSELVARELLAMGDGDQ